MKPRVYVETSVVSYLTAQPSRDIVIAARQQITREWRATAAGRFDFVISELVREEAAGNHDTAQSLLVPTSGLPMVAISAEVTRLAEALVDARAVPRRGGRDAVHIAIPAVRQIPFLVTWNFRHIANAASRRQIEAVCRASGIDAPVLCTPEQLVTEDAEMKPDLVAEVRAVRERLAARFDYDMGAIVRHVQKLEAETNVACAPSPRREAVATDSANERTVREDARRTGAPPRGRAGTVGG